MHALLDCIAKFRTSVHAGRENSYSLVLRPSSPLFATRYTVFLLSYLPPEEGEEGAGMRLENSFIVKDITATCFIIKSAYIRSSSFTKAFPN